MQAANCCLDLLTPLTHADPLIRDKVVWLCPLFRAVVRIEILRSDSFAEFESSLDGPLLMFEEVDSFGTLSGAEQEKICVSLYFSISWLRQVINAFVTQDSHEVHEALCQRLLQSMMLQRKLSNYIKKSPRCATALLALLGVAVKAPVLTLDEEEDSDCADEHSDSFQAITTALFDSSSEGDGDDKGKENSQKGKLSKAKTKGNNKVLLLGISDDR